MTGFASDGTVLFTTTFQSVPLAQRPDEEHFTVVVELAAESVSQLCSVQLRSGDGRIATRSAALSAEEFAAALAMPAVVEADRLSAQVVRLRWNASLFPALLVRDPDSREVSSLAQGGLADIVSGAPVLEVTISDGVRSGTKLVPVR